MTLSAGAQLGPYRITAELGHGGMGVVYTAHDPRLDRQVAIKVLPPDLTSHETAKERFLQEAKAASALDHPNICTIHEINETADGQLYLVMAHYEGETLKERIERGALPVDDAIDIATQVGRGLAEAHGAGIVHRDIKPANVLLAKGGTVKILDFGLAKLAGTEGVTQTGTAVGTVAYMSPEQARGDEVDHRTDIWSLGVVLHEMLSGQPPFHGENLLALAHPIQQEPPPALTGNASALTGVVVRSLDKSQSHRYQALTVLLADLQGATAPGTQAPSQPDVPSIAVLPFANMSADPDQEYFCEGLAEELIDALARVQNLRVVSRTSAFQITGKGHDLQQVAEKLKVKLLGNKVTPVIKRATDKLDAYNLVLQGRFLSAKLTADALEQSRDCFTKALAVDPAYAQAHSGIAFVHSMQAYLFAAPRQVLPLAEEAARRALALDEAVADAHFALAVVLYMYEWNWEGADREFRRALDLNPGDSLVRGFYALLLVSVGRHEESLAEARRGIELDPLSLLARHLLAISLYLSRRFDEAIEEARAGIGLEKTYLPCHWDLGWALAAQGRNEDAVDSLTLGNIVAPNDPIASASLAWALGLAGRREEGLTIRSGLLERRADGYVSAFLMALASVGLGDIEQAFSWLHRAEEERDPNLALLREWPGLDPLRSDPRFQALLQKMNFPETVASVPPSDSPTSA